MSNKDHNKTGFRNEDTLVRRAWIESALQGVRARIEEPAPVAESGNLAMEERSLADAENPGLYLAWDADERRSGT